MRFEGIRLAAPGVAGKDAAVPVGAGEDAESRQAVYVAGGATRVLRQCVVENTLAFGALRTMPSSSVLIRACLFRNNQRDLGIGAAVDNEGDITIVESTLVDIANTLLAGNSHFFIRATGGSNDVEDCGGSGSIVSQGHSLVSDTTNCPFSAVGPGNLLDLNPMLGVLGNHGGPTPTVRLQPGSPAIDAGDPLGCPDPMGVVLPTDQRGFVRIGRCDIGAFEAGSPGPDPIHRDGFEDP